MISIDANLQINSADFNAVLFNQDDALIINIQGSNIPKFPLPTLRQFLQSKAMLSRLDQTIRVQYEGKPVFAIQEQSFKVLSIRRFIRLFVQSRM